MQRLKTLYFLMRQASAKRSLPGQLLDLILHKLFINIGPRDYYYFEFYASDKSWAEKARYTSLRGSRYWLFEKNSFKYQILFTDKYIQKGLLSGLNLPTPRLLGLIGTSGSVRSREEFQLAIDRADHEFMLKPVSSYGGHGIRRIQKVDGSLFEGGQSVMLDEIWEDLSPHMARGVVMEAVIQNAAKIRDMNPSSLNTFRVITFSHPSKGWQPICSYLRVGRGNSVVDNRSSGGLVVQIDSDGTAVKAVDMESRTDYSHHPDHGAPIAGVVIEEFSDCVQFAVDASAHFSQMGVLGWDIALTEDGPMVVEVNAAPTIDNPQLVFGGLITDDLAEVLAPRRIFSRYPKTHMYPKFDHGGTRLV
jgi:hypothetical protein